MKHYKIDPNIMIYVKSEAILHDSQGRLVKGLGGIGSAQTYKDIIEDSFGFGMELYYPYYMDWALDRDKLEKRTLTREEWHKARKGYGGYMKDHKG